MKLEVVYTITKFVGYFLFETKGACSQTNQPNDPNEHLVGNIPTPLVKGRIVTVIPKLDKEFLVSFDVNPNNFTADYRSVIHFSIGSNINSYGDRVPAVWFYANGKLHISSAINGNCNRYFDTIPVELNKWTNVEVSQILKNSVYVYRIRINGKVVFSENNNQTQSFKNVTVFASDPWYEVQNGSFKNLFIINGLSCSKDTWNDWENCSTSCRYLYRNNFVTNISRCTFDTSYGVLWSQWSDWSTCSSTGFLSRNRVCSMNNLVNCSDKGYNMETRNCTYNPCNAKPNGIYLIQDVFMFLNCTSEQEKYVNCSVNQIFDPSYSKCMDVKYYNLSSFCIGRFDSNYRNPWNCHSYIDCHITSSEVACQPSLVYNPNTDQCVNGNNFLCVNITTTTSSLKTASTNSLTTIGFQPITLSPSYFDSPSLIITYETPISTNPITNATTTSSLNSASTNSLTTIGFQFTTLSPSYFDSPSLIIPYETPITTNQISTETFILNRTLTKNW